MERIQQLRRMKEQREELKETIHNEVPQNEATPMESFDLPREENVVEEVEESFKEDDEVIEEPLDEYDEYDDDDTFFDEPDDEYDDDYNFEPETDEETNDLKSKITELLQEISLHEQAVENSVQEEPLIEENEEPSNEEELLEENETPSEEALIEAEELENVENLDLDFYPFDSDEDSYDFDSQPDIELTIIEGQPDPKDLNEELENLPNETYDAEFEPSDPSPSTEELSPKEQKKKAKRMEKEQKKKHKKEKKTMEEVWDTPAPTLFPIPEEKQIPSSFMEEQQDPVSLSVEPVQQVTMEEKQEAAPFMPLVPISPVKDCPVETFTPVNLEDNPYFRNKKMNFKMKPFIVSTLTVVFFIGLFISIFVILNAFK